MARSIVLVTSALLAILSPLAQAKVKNELRTYAFTSDDCNGPAIGGNMDLELGKCHDIPHGANSIKPFNNKHDGWIDEVNAGTTRCVLYTYQHHGCQGNPTSNEELPRAISYCISPVSKEPLLSVLFHCGAPQPLVSLPDPQVITSTIVSTTTKWYQQSNSFTPVGSPVTGTYTRTEPNTIIVTSTSTVARVESTSTVTLVTPPLVPDQTVTVQYPFVSTNIATVYVEDYSQSHMRRSDSQQISVDKDTQNLEPHSKTKWKGPRIGVWMLHPWTLAVVCYECYAKSPDNTYKFECRSGPNNPVACPRKVPNPHNTITVTHTPVVTVVAGNAITSVVTVEAPQPRPVTTTTVYEMIGGEPSWTVIGTSVKAITLGQKEGDLEPRSFHRAVRFTHPWHPNMEMCADAEWDSRGKSNAEVRIQKPDTKMKKCDKDPQMQRIDASPVTIDSTLPTQTIAISTTTVYPTQTIATSTVYVDPSPPIVTTITTISGSAPAPPTVTVTVIDPEPAWPTFSTIIGPAPAWPTTTITIDAESPRDTVTVESGFASTTYTTIYQDRRRHHDL